MGKILPVRQNSTGFTGWCKVKSTTSSQWSTTISVLGPSVLEKWEKAWGMEFHLGKCNSMSSTRPRSPFEHRYTLKWHIFEDVKEAKYLGLTLSSNLTWNTHIGNITSKANKLLGSLRRNLKIINESTKENAYKAIVRSNLENCYKQSGHHIQKRTKMKLKKSSSFCHRKISQN